MRLTQAQLFQSVLDVYNSQVKYTKRWTSKHAVDEEVVYEP